MATGKRRQVLDSAWRLAWALGASAIAPQLLPPQFPPCRPPASPPPLLAASPDVTKDVILGAPVVWQLSCNCHLFHSRFWMTSEILSFSTPFGILLFQSITLIKRGFVLTTFLRGVDYVEPASFICASDFHWPGVTYPLLLLVSGVLLLSLFPKILARATFTI